MRYLVSVGLAAALLLAAVPVALGLLQGLSRSHGAPGRAPVWAAASSTLTCSVKASCGEGEVAVFRMSGQANAHAQTAEAHPTTYDYTVCCVGPAGLSTLCSGSHATVLRLWAADNAHAAEPSDTHYTTEVCLSSDTGMSCQYVTGDNCGAGYACLATISNTTKAHVADCDGSDDYPTKVCCAEGAAPAVGGIAELPDIAGASGEQSAAPAEGSGWSAGSYAALAGGVAAAAVVIAVAGWYARRRWLR